MLRQAAAAFMVVLAGAVGALSASIEPSVPAPSSAPATPSAAPATPSAAPAAPTAVPAPAAPAAAPAAPSAPTVTVRDGKVTATLQQAPIDEVIDAIADETGAELRGVPPDREVTLQLDAVPVEDALERLLGSHSFTLTYDADGHLKRIELSTADDPDPAAKAATATAAPASTEDPGTPENATLNDYIHSNPTVQVGGRLGQVLGTKTSTFQDVMREALKNEDPRVRAEGRRAMVKSLVTDPEVRDALVATVDGMPAETLARALRGVAGADAAQLAAAFARYGRSAALSQRMQAAMVEIRNQDDGS